MPKKLDELALDEVIMSPDELISIPEEPSRLLHYIGTDEWARPVYQDQYGKLWKDVELGDFEIPHLHSAVGNEFDGEPDMPIRKPFRILTDKPKNPYEFQYMMLSRLQSDCEYYLNYGNRCTGHLYYHNESKQIAAMKKLWNEFPDDGKPEWLTWEQILEYEKQMSPDYKIIISLCLIKLIIANTSSRPDGRLFSCLYNIFCVQQLSYFQYFVKQNQIGISF